MLSPDESIRAASQGFDIVDDRMILYPSARVQHQLGGVHSTAETESQPVNSRGFFKICYYIHGRK